MADQHPDFARAKEANRWAEPLDGLRKELESRAYRVATAGAAAAQHGGEWKWGGGTWSWVMLPDGALVAMKVRSDFRFTLRVARSDAPETLDGKRKWDADLSALLDHLGCGSWQRVEETPESGVAVQFVQLYETEHAVGLTRCTDCGAEIGSLPIVRVPRCRSCAAATLRSRLMQTS